MKVLTQSAEETAACELSYVTIHIDGQASGDSQQSDRGQDIHDVMARYVKHCAFKSVPADWVRFNELAKASGPEAATILEGIRDSYTVDFAHVYGTEISLAVDANLRPTCRISDERYEDAIPVPGVSYSDEPAAYAGKLDVARFSDDGTEADIDDYKSTPGIFDAETIQSERYAFLLMRHFPDVETVRFNLIFVRYRNCVRTVTYTRTDMPRLADATQRALARQAATHADPKAARAIPNPGCIYCPLLRDLTCPQGKANPYAAMSVQERLQQLYFFRQAAKYHTPLLKQFAEVEGDVSYSDGNGVRIRYGREVKPVTKIPLNQALIDTLDDYTSSTGDDWKDWNLGLKTTPLKSKLAANKKRPARADLESQLYAEGFIDGSEMKPKWGITTSSGFEEDLNPYEDQ